MKPSSKSLAPDGPLLLAFGAHPDDIEFGCGGVIARETQAGPKAAAADTVQPKGSPP